MIDLRYYDNLTEKEVRDYIQTLDRESFTPQNLTCEKWDGKSFNGLEVETIKEDLGDNIFLMKENEKLLFICQEDILKEYKKQKTEEALEAELREHFKSRLLAVDENGEPIQREEIPEQEVLSAEILLNQQDIIIKQREQDEVLAAILLSQQEVTANV